jgi:DNA-binding IclR family transcriptional regulator
MTEADEPPRSKDPADVVIVALRKAAAPSSPEEIASATGLGEATVRRTLGRLVSMREARRAGGGRYTAAKHGTMGR